MRRGGWLVVATVVGAGATPPAAAYQRSRSSTGVALEWGRRCIPFWINERGSADLPSFAIAEDAVLRSFEAWDEVACSDLDFIYQGPTDIDEVGADFRNVVVWRDEDGSWDHSRGVIALTTTTFCQMADGRVCDAPGRILDADIELNGVEFTFSHTQLPQRIKFDLRNTLTHEVGHLIGLDHSSVAEATMAASAPPGETAKATLHPDDIEGLCAIYPASGGEPAPCEPIPDPSDLQTATEADGGCSAVGATPAAPLALLTGLLALRRRRAARGARLGRTPG